MISTREAVWVGALSNFSGTSSRARTHEGKMEATDAGNLEERRSVVAVDYPGPVEDLGRVLQVLGGVTKVLELSREALRRDGEGSTENRQTIEIRLREDTDRPLLSSRLVDSSGLVLRVSRDKEGGRIREAKLVAKLEQSFVFDGLADFQYFDPPKSRDVSEYIMEGLEVSIEGMIGENGSEELYMLPPFFTKTDQPLHYNHKEYQAPTHVRDYPKGSGKLMKNPIQTVDYHVNVIPALTDPQITFKDIPQELVEKINDMFKKRPVWSIGMIMEILKGHNMGTVRRVLASFCYRFANGPWGKLWVCNGYDPRTDPQAGLLQALYYRLPVKWYKGGMNISMHERSSGPPEGEVSPSGSSLQDVCAFKVLPNTRGIFVQLCDLVDDEIQEILKKNLDCEGLTCEEANGWFDRDTMDRVRFLMYTRFCAIRDARLVMDQRYRRAAEDTPRETSFFPLPLQGPNPEEEDGYELLEEDSMSSNASEEEGSGSDG